MDHLGDCSLRFEAVKGAPLGDPAPGKLKLMFTIDFLCCKDTHVSAGLLCTKMVAPLPYPIELGETLGGFEKWASRRAILIGRDLTRQLVREGRRVIEAASLKLVGVEDGGMATFTTKNEGGS
jgi:hypothetical protein